MSKIFLSGTSQVITVPRRVMGTLKLQTGDGAHWNFDEKTGRWYIISQKQMNKIIEETEAD